MRMIQTMGIKLLVMDVDGTLTDGGIYMGDQGELFKRFNIKDGYAIRHILPELGIEPVILTGRKSEIVNVRCRELNVRYVFQASSDKAASLEQIMEHFHVDGPQVAYMGDDLNDLPAMKLSGLKGCPADAAEAVRKECEFVSDLCGGNGAVRQFIEWLSDKEG